jgi:tRNA (cytidine/uridine-2'-O-)-methyltransferase
MATWLGRDDENHRTEWPQLLNFRDRPDIACLTNMSTLRDNPSLADIPTLTNNPDLPFMPALPEIPPHRLKVALLYPQIAPNTGNIARACVASGTALHLVRPLGFVLSDRNLRRSAMDYWPRLRLHVHDDADAFFAAVQREGGGIWLFSSKARKTIWDAEFADGDWLIFGSETAGIAPAILSLHPQRALRIPQAPGERCLNVSTAVGIGLFEALRQLRPGRMVSQQNHAQDGEMP